VWRISFKEHAMYAVAGALGGLLLILVVLAATVPL
jgi:hypothetical protein